MFPILQLTCLASVASSALATHAIANAETLGKSTKDSFDWTSINGSDSLVYHDCYDGYQCAKLILPLDWLDLSNPNNVSIAITKVPAKVDQTDSSYGGSILLNPGGPSGSGVSFVRRAGRRIQSIVDGEKKFEILSFDPRGVSFSEPNAHCFSDTTRVEIFQEKLSLIGGLDQSPDALPLKWAYYEAQGQLCAHQNVSGYENGDNIRSFVSTPSVARDMVAIVDKLDEYQSDLARKTPFLEKGNDQFTISSKPKRQLPLLQYWGFSYGTVLGNTFVSMFPERVGKVILDGVADSPDYMETGWTTNLQDTEKVMSHFYEACFFGNTRCPLFRPADSGPQDLKARLDSVLETLKEKPIPVVYDGEARLITYHDLRTLIFRALYRPYTKFPKLATAINELMYGNYTAILQELPGRSHSTNAADNFKGNKTIPFPVDDYYFSGQVQPAIICGDGVDKSNTTILEFREYLDLLVSQSPTVGGSWAEIVLNCVGWKFRPKFRYPGPFSTSGSNATANPVFFIGNTKDPVTPLRNAIAAAARHEGARVLTQDSAGHCSLLSTANACTAEHVRQYFQQGKLPAEGTVCPNECIPWMEYPCEVVENTAITSMWPL